MDIATTTLQQTSGIPFPNIDPVLFEYGFITLRWYALSYIAGILCGWYYLGTLNKKNNHPLSQKAYDDFILFAVLGIMLGGRFGYVVFYNLPYYLSNPSEILHFWQGGMSFHGGLIGAITAMYLLCRINKLRFLAVMDLVACITPIGLFFGRIANFINGELYGRAVESDIPWGVIFPGDDFARHPSQLYEAILEGLVLGLVLAYFAMRKRKAQHVGFLSGLFLLGYALARQFIEFYREPDAHIGFIIGEFTMGQVLSLPMVLLGLYLILSSKRRVASTPNDSNEKSDNTTHTRKKTKS